MANSLNTLLNIPNVLSLLRLLLSPVLVTLAWRDQPDACLVLFLFLFLTDWLDGKLAWLLNQCTEFGAKLDSVADVTFYSCTFLALLLLRFNLLCQEVLWLIPALLSYPLNVALAWYKFRHFPAYHTRLAKTSWLLVGIAVITTLASGPIWPLRLAAACVLITNLEQMAITWLLTKPRVDVRWIGSVLRTPPE